MKLLLLICLLLSGEVFADDRTALPSGLVSLSGENISLASGPVHLIFLDALCPMPHFPGCEETIARLAREYRRDAHNVVAVFNALYVDETTVQAFVQKHQLTMPVVVDVDMTLHRALSIHATPYQVSLDNGAVVYRGSQLKSLIN